MVIMLTKLDHTRILVGFESVKYIEETPDTLIRFLNGESLMVRESLDEIMMRANTKTHADNHLMQAQASAPLANELTETSLKQ